VHHIKTVRVLRIDPLADEYNELLRRYGYPSSANILRSEAENLSQAVPCDHFHIAYSRNALDHSWQPARCISEMLKIVRKGGHVYISGATDEGVRQNYEGLHQWNFRAKGTDDFIIWRPGESISLRDYLGDSVKFTASGNDEEFELSITK
jgi:SAM-dependent methyltransferase